jgi:hypothetical protein
MHAPLYSTITLIAELFVSAAIYYSLYQGYKHNRFPAKLAGAALLYEILFNISYMVTRVGANENAARVEPPFVVGLAIVHGTLSLLMFIALIVFFFFAWRKYLKGKNYFHEHKILTTLFLIFWTFSILSGITFYIVDYLIP